MNSSQVQNTSAFRLNLSFAVCVVALVEIVVAAWSLSWLVPRAMHFESLPPVPLRANAYLVSIAIVGIVIGCLAVWYARKYDQNTRQSIAALMVVPVLFSVGVILVALSPSDGPVLSRDQVFAKEKSPQRSFAVPFFFETGKDRVTGEELLRLQNIITIFESCTPSEIIVRGFASSSPFASDSNNQNRNLANRRSTFVTEALLERGIKAKRHEWKEYDVMRKSSRLRDSDENKRIIQKTEPLNRRAELLWLDSDCVSLIAAPSTPTSSKSEQRGRSGVTRVFRAVGLGHIP